MQRPINTTHTNTHTSSHETRGNQRVVLPPAKPPSLLLTAPPRSPTNPNPNPPATSPPPPQAPPPPCGMPAAVCLKEALCAADDGRAMLVKPRFVAELAEKDAFLRRRAIIFRMYCLFPPPTHTYTHTHTHTHTHTNIYIHRYSTRIAGCRSVNLY